MHRIILTALGVTLLGTVAGAGQIDLVFDPAHTSIEFTLDATMHQVHGTFELASGTVRYDPATGQTTGRIVVDARSGESGNARRDRDMHAKVLDSEAHPTIALVPERVIGELPPAGTGSVTVSGWFLIGGGKHEVEIPLAVTVTGDEVEIQGQFEVPYVEWGLDDPSKFVLRVAKEVTIAITAHGSLSRVGDTPAD